MNRTGHPIYLDYNASTPVPPRVRAAVLRALEEGFGNPSAGHPYGRRARDMVERARAQVAALLGAASDEIFFTSGGTEASNLALRGVLGSVPVGALVTTTIEHPATQETARLLEAAGVQVVRVAPGVDGSVGAEQVAKALSSVQARPAVVSVIIAQNETGVLQPVAEIVERVRGSGVLVHADAAQAVGKIPVDVKALGVDLLSVAGHKLYAPKGVGALYVRRGVALQPLLVGGGHERGVRAGTENVSGVVGLGEACGMALECLDEEVPRLRGLRDSLEQRLGEAGFVVHGGGAARLPNTLNGRFPGVRGGALAARLADELAFTTGSACHAGREEASAVLLAMGIDAEDALGAIRLSLGRGTTEEEVTRAGNLLLNAAAALRAA
ncbi:cysteine desulfurase family protein [Chondromyces apiculatus]|uniref:cysteine desulfurase n=1 Tax=Chondromyces apiculatus DSM 436 TaxID=1192034 RepID=A0A017SXK7_9BACT|nr:cysteine desulfurase family protein [Chondromyces apiculatus]EYF01719.1 Cysteine desulfurase [Chondromyces apiculatus DSM 436]